MLYVLATSREECQRVERVMSWLVATSDESTVVEEFRREVDDGLVRAVVLTQQNATRVLRVVRVVQTLEE